MSVLPELLERNRAWAGELAGRDPEFFLRLARQQAPDYFWIGCSDSRVPAEQVVGLLPGELFVHRNVANVVAHTDLNCLSALQFAVDALGVKHVIVCGHYGCGGVLAALRGTTLGLVEHWIRHVQDVKAKHESQLEALGSEAERLTRLCELNVIEQVANLSRTPTVRGAWSRGQALAVHGWVYDLKDGRLRDLGVDVSGEAELEGAYRAAVAGGGG